MPEQRDAWASLPWWAMTAILLVGDDMTQYWWHRVSHTPLLWPLHRAHHSAHYMSIRITYRNNFFYYLMMPGLWISGVLIYLGLGTVYLVYIVVKLAVILGAHSAVRWDEPLYRVRALRPLAWLVERTVSTPATHWGHHALTNDDGIGHYTGNFGNLLFFWDVLFGTAKITRRYPAEVGLPDDRVFGKERWYVEMFYPLLRSKRAHSTLVPGARAWVPDAAGASAAGR
jgi:sterol desaturase/sphingolipid hydroxylase (fatty acid hydroxylase superfamily)